MGSFTRSWRNLRPITWTILSRNTYMRGGNTVIKVGDTEIEYNDNFR